MRHYSIQKSLHIASSFDPKYSFPFPSHFFKWNVLNWNSNFGEMPTKHIWVPFSTFQIRIHNFFYYELGSSRSTIQPNPTKPQRPIQVSIYFWNWNFLSFYGQTQTIIAPIHPTLNIMPLSSHSTSNHTKESLLIQVYGKMLNFLEAKAKPKPSVTTQHLKSSPTSGFNSTYSKESFFPFHCTPFG